MEDLNELIKVAREAAFFIRSIDGYENSKLANSLSSLADKVEKHKLLVIGRLAARVVMRNNRKAVEHRVQRTVDQPCAKHNMEFCSECYPVVSIDFNRR